MHFVPVTVETPFFFNSPDFNYVKTHLQQVLPGWIPCYYSEHCVIIAVAELRRLRTQLADLMFLMSVNIFKENVLTLESNKCNYLKKVNHVKRIHSCSIYIYIAIFLYSSTIFCNQKLSRFTQKTQSTTNNFFCDILTEEIQHYNNYKDEFWSVAFSKFCSFTPGWGFWHWMCSIMKPSLFKETQPKAIITMWHLMNHFHRWK